ncbi:hypothetical protein D3C78_1516860 [compost metagenome]
MAVAGVAGVGHEDFIAGIDQRQAGELQRGRGAGCHDNAARRYIHAKALGIPAADALAQRVQAQGRRVLGMAFGHGARRGLLHQRWCREIGFADVQKDHRFAGVSHFACQGLCCLGHFHHIKRLNPLGACRNLHRLEPAGSGH